MNKLNLKYGLVAIVGLGLSANVSATDLTCSDIVFTPEAFASYEFVDQACLEMVDRNGGTYAKMTARVVSQSRDGTDVRFRHSDGELGPRHRSNMSGDFMTSMGSQSTDETNMDGRATRLKDLAIRQDMNIYVPNKFWASAEMVEEAIVEEAVEEAVEAMVVEEVVEEMAEEELEAELPTTAGPLPWLALFGSLFLLLGGALRFSRKQ